MPSPTAVQVQAHSQKSYRIVNYKELLTQHLISYSVLFSTKLKLCSFFFPLSKTTKPPRLSSTSAGIHWIAKHSFLRNLFSSYFPPLHLYPAGAAVTHWKFSLNSIFLYRKKTLRVISKYLHCSDGNTKLRNKKYIHKALYIHCKENIFKVGDSDESRPTVLIATETQRFKGKWCNIWMQTIVCWDRQNCWVPQIPYLNA